MARTYPLLRGWLISYTIEQRGSVAKVGVSVPSALNLSWSAAIEYANNELRTRLGRRPRTSLVTKVSITRSPGEVLSAFDLDVRS
jgi:hypothetical protein